ncbi:MAG: flagellar basal body-associated FliL family protein [Pseudomonadota bacterium]
MSKPKKPAKQDQEGGKAEAKKPSMVLNIIVILLLTAIAAAAGFGTSMMLTPINGTAISSADEESTKNGEMDSKGEEGEHEKSEKGDDKDAPSLTGYAKTLAPILTNLAAPSDVWVRLELALVADDMVDDALAEAIHQDLFAYMRTVRLHHVEGPSGYLNLKAELAERASIRSRGAVEKILVRTLLFE